MHRLHLCMAIFSLPQLPFDFHFLTFPSTTISHTMLPGFTAFFSVAVTTRRPARYVLDIEQASPYQRARASSCGTKLAFVHSIQTAQQFPTCPRGALLSRTFTFSAGCSYSSPTEIFVGVCELLFIGLVVYYLAVEFYECFTITALKVRPSALSCPPSSLTKPPPRSGCLSTCRAPVPSLFLLGDCRSVSP